MAAIAEIAFVAADIPPAKVGDSIKDVDSPACVVDLDALETNIREAVKAVRAASHTHTHTVTIRPHSKSHKSAFIARKQMELSDGLISGFCCQKVVEAQALVAAGIKDVLVSNEIVCLRKIKKMAQLCKMGARVSVLVDDESNARMLSAIASAEGVTIDVLIEVDVGQKRCGVVGADEAVALGHILASLPGLMLRGIQCYQGAAQHVRGTPERERIIAGVSEKARQVRDAMRGAGLCCDVVTGGGTGTYVMEASSGVFTEVQPGSYVFNDADYWTVTQEFRPSLILLSTVMSRRRPTPGEAGWIVVDSGLKAQSTDSGLPLVLCTADEYAKHGMPEWDASRSHFISSVGHFQLASVSDEHSKLLPRDPLAAFPDLGTQLLLLPGHCDPFVNHYDWIVFTRRGVVEAVSRITARSPGV